MEKTMSRKRLKEIENKKESTIIEINTVLGLKTIWKLDKYKNVIVDITSEYKPKVSTEDKKPSTVKQ